MPTTAPAVKIEGAKKFGAEVVFAGTTTLHRKAKAEEIAAERGLTMIPPFDHEWIIAGQGTLGLEILEQCPHAGTVLVPVGGGGLVSGVAAALKQAQPGITVVGVEPAGAASMKASIDAGEVRTLDSVKSIADGLLAVRPGELNFAHVRRFVDRLDTVERRRNRRGAALVVSRRQDRRGAERCRHGRGGAAPAGRIHATDRRHHQRRQHRSGGGGRVSVMNHPINRMRANPSGER